MSGKIKFLLFLLSALAFAKANAACTNNISSTNINYGVINVQRDAASNSAISNEIFGIQQMVATCQDPTGAGDANGIMSSLSSAGSYNGNAVFATSLNGIGIMMGINGGFNAGQWKNFIPAGFTGDGFGGGGGTVAWSWTFQPYIQFVKTASQAESGVFSAQIGYYQPTYQGNWKTGIKATPIPITVSGSIVNIKCAITTPNLTFPIGDVLASKFGTSIGTVPSGAQNTQSLGLNCDTGANINVTLQGTQNPDVSTTSILALSNQGNAGVAKGVGVQLLYNGAPLVLNNRIVLKQSTGGQETFPITARYYQTKTSVATGKANASATLDLTYQ